MAESLTLAFKLRDHFPCLFPLTLGMANRLITNIKSHMLQALCTKRVPWGTWREVGLKQFACLCFLKEVQFPFLSSFPNTRAKMETGRWVTPRAKSWNCKWGLPIYGYPERISVLSTGRKPSENRIQIHTSSRKRHLDGVGWEPLCWNSKLARQARSLPPCSPGSLKSFVIISLVGCRGKGVKKWATEWTSVKSPWCVDLVYSLQERREWFWCFGFEGDRQELQSRWQVYKIPRTSSSPICTLCKAVQVCLHLQV